MSTQGPLLVQVKQLSVKLRLLKKPVVSPFLARLKKGPPIVGLLRGPASHHVVIQGRAAPCKVALRRAITVLLRRLADWKEAVYAGVALALGEDPRVLSEPRCVLKPLLKK